MSMLSWFTFTCRLCGDESRADGTNGQDAECHRCWQMKVNMRNLSLAEIARIIDAAAEVPEGTHQVTRREYTEEQ